MWKWLEQYFTFTKSERQAIIALVVLSVLVLIAPKVYFFFKPAQITGTSKYQKELDAFANSHHATNDDENANPVDSSGGAVNKPVAAMATRDTTYATHRVNYNERYFDFDPNKIGVNEWVRLGFTEKQARSIEKYKATGAKFYKPADMKRLYVMTDEHYEKLQPYIKIDVEALPKKEYRRRNEN